MPGCMAVPMRMRSSMHVSLHTKRRWMYTCRVRAHLYTLVILAYRSGEHPRNLNRRVRQDPRYERHPHRTGVACHGRHLPLWPRTMGQPTHRSRQMSCPMVYRRAHVHLLTPIRGQPGWTVGGHNAQWSRKGTSGMLTVHKVLNTAQV